MGTQHDLNSVLTPAARHLLQTRLAACKVGHTLVYHHTIPTTMTVAAALAQERTARSGTVVLAERQEAGRGRQGRRWEAPAGQGLLMSVLLRPPDASLPATHAPMLAGVAVMEAVAETVPQLAATIALKWPNDLVVATDSAELRKTGGVIAESALRADGALAHLVLGIGINVNQTQAELPRVAPPSLRPTSLRLTAGQTVERAPLLEAICRRLDHWLGQDADTLFEAWRSHLVTLGNTVTVYEQQSPQASTYDGVAEDVTADGGLVVRLPTGEHRVVHAADVSVRGRAV